MKPIRYFSLFTGIGGFELGILQAYARNHRSKSKKGTAHHARGGKPANRLERDTVPVCVGYSEIDKYAIQIYQKHYPTHKNYGDITKINEKALPEFDILFGGFPCQSFSIAGKRRGFEDTRGTLFFDICRIAKEKQPRLIFLENVKGLLSHDEGRTFTTIIAALDELGYDLQWQVLNSKDFGVPQNRERIFIVGHLRGTSRPEIFPIRTPDEDDTRADADRKEVHAGTLTARQYANAGGNFVREDLAYTLKARHDGGIDKKHPQTLVIGTFRTQKDGKGFRQMKENIAPTIQARARNDGSGQPVIKTGGVRQVKVREATSKGYAIAEPGDSINLSVMGSKTRRGRVGKGVAQTLDTSMQQHTLTEQGGGPAPHASRVRATSGVSRRLDQIRSYGNHERKKYREALQAVGCHCGNFGFATIQMSWQRSDRECYSSNS